MMDAVIADLRDYMDRLEEDEDSYNMMLKDLRNEQDPDNWDDIIDSYGWGDADRLEIIEDIYNGF